MDRLTASGVGLGLRKELRAACEQHDRLASLHDEIFEKRLHALESIPAPRLAEMTRLADRICAHSDFKTPDEVLKWIAEEGGLSQYGGPSLPRDAEPSPDQFEHVLKECVRVRVTPREWAAARDEALALKVDGAQELSRLLRKLKYLQSGGWRLHPTNPMEFLERLTGVKTPDPLNEWERVLKVVDDPQGEPKAPKGPAPVILELWGAGSRGNRTTLNRRETIGSIDELREFLTQF